MLSEIANQWSWLNDRHKTGKTAGCPKWLLDDSGEYYESIYRRANIPWSMAHCAQDMLQSNMPSAMNKHLPAAASVQMGFPDKWMMDFGVFCKGNERFARKDCVDRFVGDCQVQCEERFVG